MQLSLGAWMNVDKSTVSRAVWRVTRAITSTPEPFVMDVNSTKYGFYSKFGIPNIVGAIDCTHVKILAPPSEYSSRIHQSKERTLNQCSGSLR